MLSTILDAYTLVAPCSWLLVSNQNQYLAWCSIHHTVPVIWQLYLYLDSLTLCYLTIAEQCEIEISTPSDPEL